jgi:hypothetical protein
MPYFTQALKYQGRIAACDAQRPESPAEIAAMELRLLLSTVAQAVGGDLH